MTPRRLLILGAFALAAIVAALLVSNRQSGDSASAQQPLLYPALKKEADSIDAIRIFKAGDVRAIELVRDASGWKVSERNGYPADAGKIRELVQALAQAKLLEQKTSNVENYSKLGVEDVTQSNAAGVRVELSGAATPVNVIVGNAGPLSPSNYVRRAGEAQSWLINTTVAAPLIVDAWLRREIINIAADRVQSATITLNEGKTTYTAAKSARDDADFKLVGLPKGKEANPSATNTFASALTSLSLSEVRTAQEFAGVPPTARATFKTFDGLVTELEGWTKESKYYVALKTAYDAALAEKFPAPSEEAKPEDLVKPEPPPTPPGAETQNPVKEEAAASNAALTGWVYEIPEYKYNAIFKPLDLMVKK